MTYKDDFPIGAGVQITGGALEGLTGVVSDYAYDGHENPIIVELDHPTEAWLRDESLRQSQRTRTYKDAGRLKVIHDA